MWEQVVLFSMGTCSDIVSASDQCKYAFEQCSSAARWNSTLWYYCHGASMAETIALIILVIYAFMVIGIAAYDFMCPNLRLLAAKSGLSQSVIGVTFLAFGNGSVDIFGAFASLKSDSSALAIGETVGAALFICGVVTGSIAMFGNFPVERQYFIRDCLFLLLGTFVVLFSVYDGVITFWECVAMVAVYVAYAAVVIQQHISYTETQIDEEHVAFEEIAHHLPIYSDNEDYVGELITPTRPSLYSAIEFHESVDQVANENGHRVLSLTNSDPELLEAAGLQSAVDMSKLLQRTGHSISQNRIRGLDFSRESATGSHPQLEISNTLTDHLPKSFESRRYTQPATSASNFHGSGSSVPNQIPSVTHGIQARRSPSLSPCTAVQEFVAERQLSPSLSIHSITSGYRPDSEMEGVIWHLFPSMHGWFHKPILAQINSLLMVPPLLILVATIPVPEKKQSRLLHILHAYLVPWTAWYLLDFAFTPTSVIALSMISICMAWLSEWWARNVLCVTTIGFILAILWVLNIATEVVGILQTLGIVLRISEAALGLTVFAIGDSLGDLISNISITRVGFPTMGMSACFAGPLLSMLIGIGGCGLVVMVLRQTFTLSFEVQPAIQLNGGLLLILLVFLLLAVPFAHWRMTPEIGIVGITAWIIGQTLVYFSENQQRTND